MAKSFSREAVIEESIRHVKRMPHDNPNWCIFCCDERIMPPNPFAHPEAPTLIVVHCVSNLHQVQTVPECALCNPEFAKIVPIWWTQGVQKYLEKIEKRKQSKR